VRRLTGSIVLPAGYQGGKICCASPPISDLLWPDRPLLERVRAAAHAGFKAIELHWPYDTAARDLRARCEENRLKLPSINTSRGDLSKDEFGLGALPGRQDEFQRTFRSGVELLPRNRRERHSLYGGEDRRAERATDKASFAANLAEASNKLGHMGSRSCLNRSITGMLRVIFTLQSAKVLRS
jgi:hydroxypyruvate isomerase